MHYIPPFIIFLFSAISIGIIALISFKGKKKRKTLFYLTTLTILIVTTVVYNKSMESYEMAQKHNAFERVYNQIVLEKYNGIEPTDEALKDEIFLEAAAKMDSLGIGFK
ncbi:hypothetical protein EFA69_12760 [Rufibacter immobilis]|uniref:Uncharacterized protein n=2 Tax=Rufibacter immobilis TaxID=1348778 RepID=A0A3M9MTS1_9BACT|nr:hypothetical protein EFA69_12760 [Rufibacter immobilis]